MRSEQQFLDRITRLAKVQLTQTKTKGEWDNYVEGATDALFALLGDKPGEEDTRSYQYMQDHLSALGEHLTQEEN